MAQKKIKVALLYGGKSKEREVSLVSAENVSNNLNSKKYSVEKIEITENNSWIKKNLNKLVNADVAFLALHGPGGEDGTVQGLLELLEVPYTDSGVLASALAMDKAKTKRLAASEGILVAPHIILKKKEYAPDYKKYISKLKGKVVIKPNRIGSSIGVTISDKKDEIKAGIEKAFEHDDELMIEPFVAGREFTVPIIGNSSLAALPVVEIRPKGSSEFFDFQAKYNPDFSDEIVPAPISKSLTAALQEIALIMHGLLECRGITRSDFIVTEKGEIYFLEINTIPGMTANSLAPKSAKAAGISYPQFLDKLIQLALNKE